MVNEQGVAVNIKGVDTKIEYSIGELHILGLWDRPFKAIQNKTKQIEVRTNTEHIPFDFNFVKQGHRIRFINEVTGEELQVKVLGVKKYSSARSFLEDVGLKHSSSKHQNIEEGILSIEGHTGYKGGIKKSGLFAIDIELIENG